MGIDELLEKMDDPDSLQTMLQDLDSRQGFLQRRINGKIIPETPHHQSPTSPINATRSPDLFGDEDKVEGISQPFNPTTSASPDMFASAPECAQDEDVQIETCVSENQQSQANSLLPYPSKEHAERFIRSKQIPDNLVSKVSSIQWQVKSVTASDNVILPPIYKVTRKVQRCVRTICNRVKGPCAHLFICNCYDNYNPCKHIYKIHSMLSLNDCNKIPEARQGMETTEKHVSSK